jgi:hypothetical protein
VLRIINGCPQSTGGCLPFNTGRFATEIHKYFTAKFKEICAFAGLECTKLLYVSTSSITATSMNEDIGHFQWFMLLPLFTRKHIHMFQKTLKLTEKGDMATICLSEILWLP